MSQLQLYLDGIGIGILVTVHGFLLAPDVKPVPAKAGIGRFLSRAGLWPARFSVIPAEAGIQ